MSGYTQDPAARRAAIQREGRKPSIESYLEAAFPDTKPKESTNVQGRRPIGAVRPQNDVASDARRINRLYNESIQILNRLSKSNRPEARRAAGQALKVYSEAKNAMKAMNEMFYMPGGPGNARRTGVSGEFDPKKGGRGRVNRSLLKLN